MRVLTLRFQVLHALLASAGIAACVAACGSSDDTPASTDPSITVKVIGFNDYHGNLQSPGTFGVNTSIPSASRPAVGGADYLAGWVTKLKASNPNNVVVGAGDFIGASPLISSLFHDEPAVETLNRIGLEFNAVGNHEFDHGATELLRLQNGGCLTDANSCKGASVGTPVPYEGAKFKWLSANVVVSASGQPLLPAYGVKSFNGVKVAFIGMTLKGTPGIVTPTGVAGLTFKDEAATVNALVPQLKAQGIEAIVVLVHQGGFQSSGYSDINGCDGNLVGSDIAGIVSQLDDAVDLIISGHTHAAYNCSDNTVDVTAAASGVASTPRRTGLTNAKGRLIPVTSASSFGRVLTDIDLTLNGRTHDVTKVSATNRLVDRTDATVTADATVKGIVDKYNTLVSPLASQVIGAISAELPITSDAACNMPAGELVADAQLAATAPSGFGGAVIAFMNRGGVRSPGFTFASSTAGEGDSKVTYGEAFTVQPFGNSLVTMTLTAQNLKEVLEEQFAGCHGQPATTTRIMIPSNGFKYTWDGSKACDARISNVTLTAGGVTETLVDASGTVINPTKTYRITVNNFMATGGDGFSTFLKGTSQLGGAQDIDALTAYMAATLPTGTPGTPYTRGATRIQRIGGTSCPSGSAVNP